MATHSYSGIALIIKSIYYDGTFGSHKERWLLQLSDDVVHMAVHGPFAGRYASKANTYYASVEH